jgi:hypothetical protein
MTATTIAHMTIEKRNTTWYISLPNPGLHGRLGADVVSADEVIVDVPGGESDYAIAFDRPDALAIEADEPEPLMGVYGGDACAEWWMLHAELDSVVLE